MPAWLIPAIKAVLPYVGSIVSAAAPVFTKKAADAAASQTVLQQQVAELQSAASDNDAHIKGLAAQIQNTVEALEKGATLAEARHRRLASLCIAAILLALASLGVALFVLAQK